MAKKLTRLSATGSLLETPILLQDREFASRRAEAVGTATLTVCQENALKDIWDWYHDKTSSSWALIGAAGTGKSFTTNILRKLLPTKKIAITAPTHKAKNVAESFTNIPGVTVHKLLGLRLNLDIDDLDIHNPQFDPQAEPTLKHHDIVFVDEASMVGDSLYELLIREANVARVKILFIGDANQLPPIRKSQEPRTWPENIAHLQDELIDKEVSFSFLAVAGISVLTTPARQAIDNPLYGMLMCLRADLERNEIAEEALRVVLKSFSCKGYDDIIGTPGKHFAWFYRHNPEMTSGKDGYLVTKDLSTFTSNLLRDFGSDEFKESTNYCKFLALRNSTIKDWNIYIRKYVFKNPDNLVIKGDLLMSYTTVYNELKQAVIVNSEEYIVTDVHSLTLPAIVMVGGYPETRQIDVIQTTMSGIYAGGGTTVFIVKPPYENFAAIHNYYHSEGIHRKAWRNYYTFKNRFLVLEDLKELLPEEYGKLPGKDIDHAFGVTIHKSQGSTFDKVSVSLRDVMVYLKAIEASVWKKYKRKLNPTEQAAAHRYILKLAYVALSRPREFANILI